MAYIFNIFRRIENYEFEFWQNKSNSRYATIRATHRKSDKLLHIASVDLKKGTVKYFNEDWEKEFKPKTIEIIKQDLKLMA